MMYDTIHQKFAKLDDDVIVYPAHGAGSLCGRSMRKATSSTIGYEKAHNYAFENRTKAEFVSLFRATSLLFLNFPFDVGLNIKGAPDVKESISKINYLPKNYQPDAKALVIDSHPATVFKASYLTNAINIQGGGAFETWLGSIVAPDSEFYLIAGDEESLQDAIKKAASIGYESKIKGAFVYDATNGNRFTTFDKNTFSPEDNKYTYTDVRTTSKVKKNPCLKKVSKLHCRI